MEKNDFLTAVIDDLRHAHTGIATRTPKSSKPIMPQLALAEEIQINVLLNKIKDAMEQAQLIKKYFR